MRVTIYLVSAKTRQLRVASPAIIGSDPRSTIALGDQNVARRHARLTVDPRGILVEALDGLVLIDKFGISEPTIIGDGHEICVGRFVLAPHREPAEMPRQPAGPDPRDAELLAALQAHPSDVAERDVYADVLEARGDLAGAAFVRDGILEPELLARTDATWRRTTSRGTIEFCNLGGCPRRWDGLEATDQPQQRACRACGRDVAYCSTATELAESGQDEQPFVLDPMLVRADVIRSYLDASKRPRKRAPATRPSELPLVVGSRIPTTLEQLEVALELRLPEDAVEMGFLRTGGAPVSRFVGSLSASCHWDSHHQTPPATTADMRWRRLASYCVIMTTDDAIEGRLRARFGEPTIVSRNDRPLRRYGPFFVETVYEGRIAINWFDETPAWAIALDDTARDAFLAQLVAAIGGAETLLALERAFPRVSTAGIEIAGTLNPGDFWFDFNPPISVERFAMAFGWRDITAFAPGVHMSTWRIEAGGTVARCGRWIVEANLTAWPTGAEAGFQRRMVGDADRVATVRLHQGR